MKSFSNLWVSMNVAPILEPKFKQILPVLPVLEESRPHVPVVKDPVNGRELGLELRLSFGREPVDVHLHPARPWDRFEDR